MAGRPLPKIPPPKDYDSWEDSDEDQIIATKRKKRDEENKSKKPDTSHSEALLSPSHVVSETAQPQSSLCQTVESTPAAASLSQLSDMVFTEEDKLLLGASSEIPSSKTEELLAVAQGGVEEIRSDVPFVFPDIVYKKYLPESIYPMLPPTKNTLVDCDEYVYRAAFWNAQYYTEMWIFRFKLKSGAPTEAVEAALVQSIVEKLIFQKQRGAPWVIIPHEEQNRDVLPLIKKYDLAERTPLLLKWATTMKFHSPEKIPTEKKAGKAGEKKIVSKVVKKKK